MAGPAGLGNQQIQAEGRQIVRERVHLRVARLVQHLRVGVAQVTGLGSGRAGVALDPLQRQCARLYHR